MAAVLGLPLQPDDEVLGDLPEYEKAHDPLRNAKILKTCSVPGGGFREFVGEVVEIEVGTISGERLYRIRYGDGDLQHFTAEEVRACMPPTGIEARAAPAPAEIPHQAAAPLAAAFQGAMAAMPEDAAAQSMLVAEMPVAAEEAEMVAGMEEQELAVAAEGEQEEIGEAFLAEEAEATEFVEAEVEQEVAVGEEEVAEETVLEELAAAAEEDLNLIVLEEGVLEEGEEDDALAELFEEPAADKAEDAEAGESELMEAYLGGAEEFEIEEPEPPTPAFQVARGPGVQRDIAKVTGRGKAKAQAKFKARPAVAQQMEMEAFDEEAT